MTYVVTKNCIDCKYTECVDVCPVDAFHEDVNRLYINPETCIDCRACVPACPVSAIFTEDDVAEEMKSFIEINKTKSHELPVISEAKNPLLGPKCENTLNN